MHITIKNKELKELDKQVFKFNKIYGMALNSLNKFPNLYASKEVTKQIKELQSKLRRLKLKDKIDKLITENYLENLEIQKIYLDYFTTRGNKNLKDVLDKMFGKGAIEILKQGIKDFDYENFWKFYLSYQDYTYRQLPSDEESLREELKGILNLLKIDVLDYAKEHFNFPQDYEFELVLGQPYSSQTYFHPSIRRIEISPGEFFIFKDNGQVKINVCVAIESLFHELIGHGRHELNSKDLPLGLEYNSINNANIITSAHTEGIAQITKDEAIKFMEIHQKKYKIEDDYIRQRELSKTSDDCTNFICYYQYLQLIKLEGGKIDIEKEFYKTTKNYGLFLLFSNSKDSPLSFTSNVNYPIGKKKIEELIKNLEKRLGKAKFKENHAIINQAISVGTWNFKVLPKIVDVFLKERGIC